MMFSESRNDWRRRIDDRACADHLRDRDNATWIGDNSAEIGDDAAGIIDITVKVTPCYGVNGDWSNSSWKTNSRGDPAVRPIKF